MGFLSDVLGTKNEFQADPSKLLNPISANNIDPALTGANQAIQQQQSFANALQNQGGLANQANVFAQQQALARTLGQQAQGIGPNVAQNQLNQATGQNVANQAALMNSQRGAGANVGMMARQAGLQGGAIQQQAAGQAATLGAQQQIAAQQALMQQQNAMQGVAGQQIGQQSNAIQNMGQLTQGQQGMMLNANQMQNQNQLGMQGINAGIASQNAQANAAMVGGALGAAGTAMGIGATPQSKAFGGEVHNYAEGGQSPMQYSGGSSEDRQARGQQAQAGFMKAVNDNPVSKAIAWLSKSDGGLISGKANVKGDSLKNDTVPAMLSPGEVVIPRHVMESDDPIKGAAEFVKQIMSKKKVENKDHFADGGVAQPLPDLAEVMTGQDRPLTYDERMAGKKAPEVSYSTPDLMESATQAVENKMQPIDTNQTTTLLKPGYEIGQAPSVQKIDNGVVSGMENAAKKIESGIYGEAKALGDLGKDQANILQKSLDERAKAQADYNAQLSTIEGRRAVIRDKIEKGDIDPNRFVHSMSTGQKITTGIGLILGGIGAGMTHGENPALKYLNQQIDNDLKSQEIDLGKNKSLLSETLQDVGNLRDARILAESHMRDATAANLQMAAAKATDPIQKARAQDAFGKWQMETEQKLMPMKIKEAAIAAYKSGQLRPEQAINAIVDEKDRDEARKELLAVNNFEKTIRSVNKLFERTKGISSALSNIPFTQSKTEMKTTNAQIIGAAREMARGQGVLSDKEVDDVIKPFQVGSMDREEQIKEKNKALVNLLGTKMKPQTPYLSQYGLAPKNPELLGFEEKQKAAIVKAKARLSANKNDRKAAAYLKEMGIE